MSGDQDPDHISTLFVERQNPTMRMSLLRFTRLTNVFSKKLKNYIHAISLRYGFYNLCRRHQSLRVSPAMALGVTSTLHDVDWIVELIDARTLPPRPRGPYRKRSDSN